MTRWFILGGAALLAVVLPILAAVIPAAFEGFSGMVIWMFLGFCSIIVVAQLGAALRALVDLLRTHAAEQPRERLTERGEQ